jgi:hypothetical protein
MCAQTISQEKYKTDGYCCEIIEINFRLNLNVSFIPISGLVIINKSTSETTFIFM